MNKFYLTIRKITVAPIIAAMMLIILKIFVPQIFQSNVTFILSLLFLGFLPLLAYPFQKYIPFYKDKGRSGQRTLAMIFAVIGYILGIITGLLLHAPKEIMLIYLEYLLSGLLIFLFNKCFHVTISGHACGIVAPVILLFHYHVYSFAVAAIFAVILIYIASLKTKRHTLPQLIGGSVIPFVPYFVIFHFLA